MFGRSPWKALLLVGFALGLAGCTNNLVDSIVITPATQTLGVGQTVQFTAIGYQNHGTHPTTNENVTSQATWTSSAPSIVTISSTGLATAVSAGTATIGATMQGFGGLVGSTAVITVTASGKITSTEPVASLAIDPGTQTAFAVNQTVDFLAIGTTGSGATIDLTGQSAVVGAVIVKAAVWTSSNPGIASINPNTGIATALSNGTTTITAQATNPDGTVVVGNATLTVTLPTTSAEPLVSMAIIPGTQTLTSLNQPAQFIAIGTTGTGTTVNLTHSVVWASSSPTVASINASTGLATALANGTTAITAIATNPDSSVVTGVASITVSISTTPEPLVSLAIVPATQTLTAAGQPAQFIAIGTTSTGATVNLTNVKGTVPGATINPAVWGSSSMSVATIGAATGLATAGSSGVTVITAIAYNPDGSAVTGTATLTVNITGSPEPLVSLAIVPASQQALAINQAADFIAIGTTSSGTTVNLTDQSAVVGTSTIAAATWTSSNPAVASVNPATGVATALTAGTAAITAIAKNPDGTVVSGTAAYTVTIPNVAEPLVSMAIVPAAQTLTLLGQTANLQAVATTGTGTTVNLTNQSATVGTATILPAVWTSSAPGVATVNPGTGVVTAVNQGTTVITATALNPDNTVVTGVSTITVTATGGSGGTIATVTVIPGTQVVQAPNQTAQYIAIGTTTTGATVDLTNQVAWSSSSAQIGTIGAATGLATSTGAGTATVTALYTPASGNVVAGNAYFTVAGGTNEQYTAVTIIPNTQALNEGQTTQFVALGTLGSSGLQVNVTNSPQIQWISNTPSIASVVVGTGLTSGISSGTATITAQLTNPDTTVVTSNASITVSQQTAPEPLLSLTIIPATLTVGNLQDTGNFLAIGTFSTAPFVQDLTNSPNTTWISSFPDDFPVSNAGGTTSASGGIVTAYASGSATIIAEYKNPSDGTIQTATAQFNCPLALPNPNGDPPTAGSCYAGQVGPLKATLTVYGEGLDTSKWYITAPSATGTPDVIHCGPGWNTANDPTETGGSVCTGIFPIGTTVTLTAAQDPSTVSSGQVTSTFGGWTYNCTPTAPITAAGPNSCTVVLGATNASVGAIFN
jgi:uncharacterized protein YjdB